MLRNRDPQHIVMIDFGLSYISTLVEDKAVDLYVMERAFLSTHPNSEQLFESLLEGYKAQSKNAKAIIDKLNQGKRIISVSNNCSSLEGKKTLHDWLIKNELFENNFYKALTLQLRTIICQQI
jgi:hypothetical protein